MIRITGGRLRGRRIGVPGGDLRPTQDRVREAIFSSLGPRLKGARVLDLFAGTGALGLEAWSRGASDVWWVESDRAAVRALERTVEELCREGPAGHCVCSDVYHFLEKPPPDLPRFDLVLADPPYDRDGKSGAWEMTLLGLRRARILASGGLLVFETAAKAPTEPGTGWNVIRERRYGSTRVVTAKLAAGSAGLEET